MFFLFIEKLLILEQQEKYDDTIKLLEDMWKNKKNDVELTLRIASQCWFFLIQENFINAKKISLTSCKDVLVKVLQESFKNGIINDDRCSWFFGYALSLSPYLFYYGNSDELYTKYEKIGFFLCEQVVYNPLNNIVMKHICNGAISVNEEFPITYYEINKSFCGNSLIELYFKEICYLSVKNQKNE